MPKKVNNIVFILAIMCFIHWLNLKKIETHETNNCKIMPGIDYDKAFNLFKCFGTIIALLCVVGRNVYEKVK